MAATKRPMFTQRHYEFIVKVLQQARTTANEEEPEFASEQIVGIHRVWIAFTDLLAEDNSNFDRKKFLAHEGDPLLMAKLEASLTAEVKKRKPQGNLR